MLSSKVNFMGKELGLELKSNDPSLLSLESNHTVKFHLFKDHGFKDYSKVFKGNMYGNNYSDVRLNIETNFSGTRFTQQNTTGININTVTFLLTITRVGVVVGSKEDNERVINYEMRVEHINDSENGIKTIEDIFTARQIAYNILMQKYADYRRNSFLNNAA